MKASAEQRFWAKVDTTGGLEACWPWTGASNSKGYGSFDHRGAHRYALEIKLGRAIGPGLFACHTCDNPPCCNPLHLFEGTHQDNVDDRQVKGRAATGDRSGARLHPERMARGDRHPARRIPGFRAGERNGRHVLTVNDIPLIRAELRRGVRWLDIASAFGVSKATISHIAAGRTWAHVQEVA